MPASERKEQLRGDTWGLWDPSSPHRQLPRGFWVVLGRKSLLREQLAFTGEERRLGPFPLEGEGSELSLSFGFVRH